MDWLEKIKAGDLVFYAPYTYSNSLCLAKVEKVTPTGQIVVNGKRFIKGDCRVSSYHTIRLQEYNEVNIEKYNEERTIAKAKKMWQAFNINDYETAKKFIEFMEDK